jgi:hypothetical protein
VLEKGSLRVGRNGREGNGNQSSLISTSYVQMNLGYSHIHIHNSHPGPLSH